MTEKWRTPIYSPEGDKAEGYQVSSGGRFWNGKRFLSGATIAAGYKQFNFPLAGIQRRTYAHRIVAFTFPDMVEGTYSEETNQIHHKDNDKANNAVSNLAWVSLGENVKFAHRDGAYLESRQYVPEETLLKMLDELHEAGKLQMKRISLEYGLTDNYLQSIVKGRYNRRQDILEAFCESKGISVEQFRAHVGTRSA